MILKLIDRIGGTGLLDIISSGGKTGKGAKKDSSDKKT